MAPRKLLVIDDEPAITALIRRAAQPCGFDIEECSDLMTLKLRLNGIQPDVICLDLAMPDFDGIEMLRYLAAQQCRAKTLIISGFNPGLVAASLRLGEGLGVCMAGAVSKPIRIAELRERLFQLARKD